MALASYDPVVGVRLGRPILERLDALGTRLGMTRSQVVRMCVVTALLDDDERSRNRNPEGGDFRDGE